MLFFTVGLAVRVVLLAANSFSVAIVIPGNFIHEVIRLYLGI